MLNIADVADLKLIRIEKATVFSAAVGASTFKHTSPPDRLCFILSIRVTMSTNVNIIADGVVIDGEPLNDAATGANVDRRFIGIFGNALSGTAGEVTGQYMVPFRRTIEIKFNNVGVGAENQTINIWALVHQDREKIFQAEATLQGG